MHEEELKQKNHFISLKIKVRLKVALGMKEVHLTFKPKIVHLDLHILVLHLVHLKFEEVSQ